MPIYIVREGLNAIRMGCCIMSKMLDRVDGWMVFPFLDCYDY